MDKQNEVNMSFLNPVQRPENSSELAEKQSAKRQKAFLHFMQYRGTLPADFDYKRELAEYRDERFGYFN